jgi:hypothetical protein
MHCVRETSKEGLQAKATTGLLMLFVLGLSISVRSRC